MRNKKTLYCKFFIVSILFTSTLPLINTYALTPPSNYTIPQSVKYQVEVNFTLADGNGTPVDPNEYYFKFSRIDNRIPNSSMWIGTPPYQESELLYHKITNSDNIPFVETDRFNNTYDLFNATLQTGQFVTLSQNYNVTLNEIKFQGIDDSEILPYVYSDEIFDLYCNNSETFFDRNDPDLIDASDNIIGFSPGDNNIKKAEKICTWVSKYLDYDDTLYEEMGASWAYDNERGDCSEYSDLMITLLRIQNIPARKVTGIVFSNKPDFRPIEGQTFTFSTDPLNGKQFLGHAWVEYYVENIGWIACDPTWHKETKDYFNRIDYQRLNFNIGAWFSIPFLPDEGEFPNPCIIYDEFSDFDLEYQIKVTVLESNLIDNSIDFIFWIIVISTIIGVFLVLGIVIYIIRRRSEDRIYQYDSY